jgi:enoyl-CoA hydratase/carnithine racemase
MHDLGSRRPQRNAWTEIMRNEIVETVDAASRDSSVRVLVTISPDL